MWMCVILVLYLVTSNAKYESGWRFVRTTQGPVRGYKEFDGVYAFYNIPYATAPTGVNKFKAPLPPPKWKRTFEAIDRGVICPQAIFEPDIILSKTKNIQEDCLIANIYVPDTVERNLSVVLYIHGGAFQVGFGDHRKARKLMNTKRIIVVNFNYRLGVHGFLCLGTKDIPGNAGMKDMVAMLRWLKQNIASFGGNPDDVTISGYSTGATAADLLILSKSATGLFKKAIIESGANTAEFAIQSDPLKFAKLYAKTQNFTTVKNIYALENFYKTLSFDTMKSKAFRFGFDSTFVFVPCIENNIGEESFLTESPINILKSGDYTKVPMLYGFTNMEGLIRVDVFDQWKTAMSVKFSDFLPSDLIFDNDIQKKHIAKIVKEFYFGGLAVDTGTILGYINYITDVMYASPALRSVSLNAAGGNNEIYLYYYSFVDKTDPYIPRTKIRGANHCAQSLAIFDDLIHINVSIQFMTFRQMMRKMWRSFIVTGKPIQRGSFSNLTWPPATINRSPHMSIGEVVKLGGKLLPTRADLWDKIYRKFYREPVPPPIPMPVKIQTIRNNFDQTTAKSKRKTSARAIITYDVKAKGPLINSFQIFR